MTRLLTKNVKETIIASSTALNLKDPGFAMVLLITNINALLTILKVPVRISLVT